MGCPVNSYQTEIHASLLISGVPCSNHSERASRCRHLIIQSQMVGRNEHVLEEILRGYFHSFKSWSEFLPMVEFAINNSVHASTTHTPFYVNGLRHPRVPTLLECNFGLRGGRLARAKEGSLEQKKTRSSKRRLARAKEDSREQKTIWFTLITL
uniref:Reverse transcriptase n=1 Tax=Peronospora matthiolae TaxID=2874970 RepID=A0AAV1VLH7_9STRA